MTFGTPATITIRRQHPSCHRPDRVPGMDRRRSSLARYTTSPPAASPRGRRCIQPPRSASPRVPTRATPARGSALLSLKGRKLAPDNRATNPAITALGTRRTQHRSTDIRIESVTPHHLVAIANGSHRRRSTRTGRHTKRPLVRNLSGRPDSEAAFVQQPSRRPPSSKLHQSQQYTGSVPFDHGT